MRKLSLKQRAFVDFYCGICNGNATESACKAGYKGSRAQLQVMGAENILKPVVVKAMDEKYAENEAEIEYDLNEWRKDVIDTKTRAKTAKNYVAEQRAQEMMAKHIGSYEADNAQQAVKTQIGIVLTPQARLADLEREMLMLKELVKAGTAIAGEV